MAPKDGVAAGCLLRILRVTRARGTRVPREMNVAPPETPPEAFAPNGYCSVSLDLFPIDRIAITCSFYHHRRHLKPHRVDAQHARCRRDVEIRFDPQPTVVVTGLDAIDAKPHSARDASRGASPPS